jgi:uncharacterized protein YndB with AHSA1/START domain
MATTSGTATVTLPSDTEIVITREFDAPAHLVFEAMTKPEHVSRWYGPRGTTLSSCEIDLRVGGTWRYVMRNDDGSGSEVAFSGEYLEIVPGKRIVQTWRFEPIPEAQTTETLTLTERDGKTLLTTHVQHASKESRDGHIESGMEGGMQETFDRLEELLQTLK